MLTLADKVGGISCEAREKYLCFIVLGALDAYNIMPKTFKKNIAFKGIELGVRNASLDHIDDLSMLDIVRLCQSKLSSPDIAQYYGVLARLCFEIYDPLRLTFDATEDLDKETVERYYSQLLQYHQLMSFSKADMEQYTVEKIDETLQRLCAYFLGMGYEAYQSYKEGNGIPTRFMSASMQYSLTCNMFHFLLVIAQSQSIEESALDSKIRKIDFGLQKMEKPL